MSTDNVHFLFETILIEEGWLQTTGENVRCWKFLDSEKRVIKSQNNRKVNIYTLYLLLVKRIDNFLSGLSQWA